MSRRTSRDREPTGWLVDFSIMSTPTQQQVMDALATVNDPEIKRPITELGMVDTVEVADMDAMRIDRLIVTSPSAD